MASGDPKHSNSPYLPPSGESEDSNSEETYNKISGVLTLMYRARSCGRDVPR
jgi:hypothetical protein